MSGPEIIGIIGLVLFWAALFSVPLMLGRAIKCPGAARWWSLAALAAFLVVLWGFTRTMAMGSLPQAQAWALAWAVPLILAVGSRFQSGAAWKPADKYVYGASLLTFLPANLVLVPTAILLTVRLVFWS